MKKTFLMWLALFGLVLFVEPGDAAVTRQFTGEVVSVAKNSVTVRRGDEEVEFARPENSGELHPGERVTVTYSMDAKRVEPSGQAAGQAAPNQRVILDDRAFYNAEVQSRSNGKKSG